MAVTGLLCVRGQKDLLNQFKQSQSAIAVVTMVTVHVVGNDKANILYVSQTQSSPLIASIVVNYIHKHIIILPVMCID